LAKKKALRANTDRHNDVLTQAGRDQEPPRAMIQRLQREMEDMQAKIAENPSSSEAGKLEKKIQWNKRRMKEILSRVSGQAEGKTKKGEARAPGLERYMVIAQKNLFTPLGSGREVKRQEFAVTGILSSGAKKVALIQLISGSASYYVAEGESFGNGAKLARIGENSVTIIHEDNKTELKLGEGISTSRSRRRKGREPQRRSEASREDDRERMGGVRPEEERRTSEKEEENRRREQEKREHIERTIDDLRRTRDEVTRKIMEMEERGDVPDDAYKKVEAIDHKIRDLESSSR
jgi:hypothetical protein